MLNNSFIPENFLILIVDDISANLKVVGGILNNVGYTTTFATSGKQALLRISNSKPDLIMLDLMMPEMDGLEVCKTIKENPDYQEIPIIFITASHEEEHLVNAFELGAVDYLTKPFRKPELLARVKTHLRLKHTSDELKKALAELDRLARIDPLTGVLNRRSLFASAEQELSRASRYQTVFSVLLIDVDHFKRINDTYGHPIGDHALVALTSTISNHIRNIDIFGRYGGEEFIIVLPQTDAVQALVIAERIRSLVSEISVATGTEALTMTISIGVAVYEVNDINIDRVFDRADQALYQAKAKGRNTCCIHTLQPHYNEQFSNAFHCDSIT